MPNIKSAKKELRKSIKRNAHNKKIKENLKEVVKKTKKSIEANEKEAKEMLAKALKALDKAAQKKIIKKNTRDRKKSRLHKKFNLANKIK
jgi:small subunit ribosomal protein S20